MAKIIFEVGDIVRYHLKDKDSETGTGVVIDEKKVIVVIPTKSRDEFPKILPLPPNPDLMEVLPHRDRDMLPFVVRVAINAALAAVNHPPIFK